MLQINKDLSKFLKAPTTYKKKDKPKTVIDKTEVKRISFPKKVETKEEQQIRLLKDKGNGSISENTTPSNTANFYKTVEEDRVLGEKVKNLPIQIADVTTDVMQAGNFLPHPIAQEIGKIGNTVGASIDIYQAGQDLKNRNYKNAAVNLGSAIIPSIIENPAIGAGLYRRSAKYNFGNRSQYLPIDRKYGTMTSKELRNNRALLGSIGAETVYDTPTFAFGGTIKPNTMKYSRVPSRKRNIAPALIGAGISMMQGVQAQEDAKVGNLLQLQNYLASKGVADVQELDNYNTEGFNSVEYYAKGGKLKPTLPSSLTKGKIPTTGGTLVPIAEGAQEVVGNTHGEKTIDNSYGVTMHNPQTGQPEAEVEDKEILVGNEGDQGGYVFSNRLKHGNKTFAQLAKAIVTKRGKVEEKLEKSTDTKDRNGLERQLAGFNMAENVLVNKQEEVKTLEGEQIVNTMLAKGGFLPKYALGGGDPRTNFMSDAYTSGVLADTVPSYKKTAFPGGDFYFDNNFPNGDFAYNGEETVRTPQEAVVPKMAGIVKAPIAGGKILPQTAKPSEIKADTVIGGKDNNVFDNLAPTLIGNAGNLVLNAMSPKVPTPLLFSPKLIEETVNINPQLAAIHQSRSGANANILRNTASSTDARANLSSSNLRHLESKLGLLGNKDNIETGLRNQNVATLNAANMAKVDATNKVKEQEFIREGDIQSRTSANLADLSKNIGEAQTRKEMQDYYDEVMLLNLLDDKTGDKARVMSRNPYYAKTRKLANATAAERKRLNR